MRQRGDSSPSGADRDELAHTASSALGLTPRQRQHTGIGPTNGSPRGAQQRGSSVLSASSTTTSSSTATSSSVGSSDTESESAGTRSTQPHAVNGVDATNASAERTRKSTSARARHWLKKKLIPQFMSDYGKTVYGGAPLAQQTLPGFFNYPSPFLLVPFFYVFMIPFVIVGALLLVQGPKHRVYEAQYSHIHQYQYLPNDPAINVNQGLFSFTADGVTHTQGTRTWMSMNVTRHLKAPVYMYYKLDNFYQNYRDFHDGRSNPQLVGKEKLGDTYTCKPYTNPGFREGESDTPINFTDETGKLVQTTFEYFMYCPCGLAPWSLFNDSFVLYRELSTEEATAAQNAGTVIVDGGVDGTVPLQLVCNGTDFGLRGEPLGGSIAENHCAKDGISWKADRTIRFHNMTLRKDWWSRYYQFETSNEYLRNGWYLHEPGHSLPDQSDYDLQVWMRASFIASFKKLYRIIHTDLDPGIYWVDITELYDVVSFKGRKSIVLHNGNWTGGRNISLGVVFLVMGCLSFVFGTAFTVECLLQRRGINRFKFMTEPKRSWYSFSPDAPEFAAYYQLRLRRHIPMAQLQVLRKTVAELEAIARGSQVDAPLTPQQQHTASDDETAEHRADDVARQPH